MDIGDWLRGLGLEQYEAAFRDNEIDGEVLPKLTADDLKDIGVAIVGHRRKMLSAIAALSGLSAAPTQVAPAAEPAPAAAFAERRQLTVMFCDLVGSTAMSARLGGDFARLQHDGAPGRQRRRHFADDLVSRAVLYRRPLGRSGRAGVARRRRSVNRTVFHSHFARLERRRRPGGPRRPRRLRRLFALETREDRLGLLRRILDGYNSRAEDLAEAVSREMGAPLSFARDAQVWAGRVHLEARRLRPTNSADCAERVSSSRSRSGSPRSSPPGTGRWVHSVASGPPCSTRSTGSDRLILRQGWWRAT